MARALPQPSPLNEEDLAPDETRRLFSCAYKELCSLAAQRLADNQLGHDLDPRALVHEVFLRFAHKKDFHWKNRMHFFATAAEAMRHVLIEKARHQNSLRRAGDLHPLQLDQVQIADKIESDLLARMNEALEKLATLDLLKAEVVRLRFFAGLKVSEVSKILGLAERTVKWHWASARDWLREEFFRPH